MTDEAGWAREEARRIVREYYVYGSEAVEAIESALLAAERRAKEECARIAQGDKAGHADCGHDEGYWDGRTDAAIAIRSTIKESP